MAATKIGVEVICRVCRHMKAPRGRSTSPLQAYCLQPWPDGSDGCSGYEMDPQVGSLWPGETDEEFGFPCNDLGTRPLTPEEIERLRKEQADGR